MSDWLDARIRRWRRYREETMPATPDRLEASCYLDAFQQVRQAFIGERLPLE